MNLSLQIEGMDFSRAGEAATRLKYTLQMSGIDSEIVRRAIIVAYEAELNIIIHAYRGELNIDVTPECISFEARDEGPGIPNIDLAMQEGYSTVPSHIREMGFGAGMGLPNINKSSDECTIESTVDEGTCLRAKINIKSGVK